MLSHQDGQQLELLGLRLDGVDLTPDRYEVDSERLTLFVVPERFELEVLTRIRPQDNTSLEGLYQSSGNFCTQCEAEGFRKITYFLDRPDVMAVYTTTLTVITNTPYAPVHLPVTLTVIARYELYLPLAMRPLEK